MHLTVSECSNLRTACLTSKMREEPKWIACLDNLATKMETSRDVTVTADPRRVLVTFTSHGSSNPRAKKFYRLAIVCEFDGEYFIHKDFAGDFHGSTKASAITAAQSLASQKGFPFVEGLWRGVSGYAMKREA